MAAQYIEPMLFSRWLTATHPTPLLPSLCAICHDWGGARVCAACIRHFAGTRSRCHQCALAVPVGVERCGRCLTEPPPYARTLAAVDYDPPWNSLITRFKFHAALDLAPALAQRLAAAHADSDMAPPDLLLPMPLSAERLSERGYNQAWELTRRLATRLRCKADAKLLLRIKDSPHQLALAPARRTANVRGVFAVEPRRRAELQGRRVTLVDDVMTTGATAAEASRVLLQAGAAQVDVWVVARTARHGAD